jgi:FAD/FMN-containing dehydrogenase
MLNVDEADRVMESLGGEQKYARLTGIKQQYDPHGLFGRNQGITAA